MANRVVADANRLRISKPGFNVLGALNANQLAFDSDWLNSLKIITSGGVTLPTAGNATVTVNYGVTLGVIPSVFFLRQTGTQWFATLGDAFEPYRREVQISEIVVGLWNVTNANNWLDSSNALHSGITIYNNRFVFRRGSGGGVAGTLRYLVVSQA